MKVIFVYLITLISIVSCKAQMPSQKVLQPNEVYIQNGKYYAFYNDDLFSGIINYENKSGYKIYVENGLQIKACEYMTDTLISCIESPTGPETGTYIEYYSDGTVKTKGHYSEGKKHGRWLFYASSGKLEKSGEYHFGNIFSVWRYYNNEEKLYKEEHYDPSGRLLKTITY